MKISVRSLRRLIREIGNRMRATHVAAEPHSDRVPLGVDRVRGVIAQRSARQWIDVRCFARLGRIGRGPPRPKDNSAGVSRSTRLLPACRAAVEF